MCRTCAWFLIGYSPSEVKLAVLTLTPGAATSEKKSFSRTQADGPRLLVKAMFSVSEIEPTAKLSGLLLLTESNTFSGRSG